MSRAATGAAPQLARVGYFGKIPARSDFVKAGDNHALAELLDSWLADTMTELTSEPRWKLHYDAMRPLHFAFVGTRSRHATAAVLDDFLGRTTLAGLEAMLAQDGCRISARRMILAVGLLLQPFGWSGSTRLDRSLVLPLPRDPQYRPAVAALWLSLAEPFLRQADVELALLVCELCGRPVLVLGFAGASPATLRGVIDPQYADGQQITFDSTGWVDDMIRGDHKVLRLSACLEQERLTLQSACVLFHETFV